MRFERAAALLEAEVGEDLLGLDAAAGACFGFNSVAADVWRLLDAPRSFDELHEALLQDYDVSSAVCAADLRELLDVMIEQGLVRSSQGERN